MWLRVHVREEEERRQAAAARLARLRVRRGVISAQHRERTRGVIPLVVSAGCSSRATKEASRGSCQGREHPSRWASAGPRSAIKFRVCVCVCACACVCACPLFLAKRAEEERRQREERERLAARQERERRKRLAKELQEQRRRAAALARQRYGARRWLAAGSWLALPYIGITLACTTETSSGGRRRHAGRPSRRYVAWGTGGNSTSRRASVLPL